MPKPGADEIITRVKHKRNYIQFGGPLPQNEMRFAGKNSQYMTITGVGLPELGTIDPIYVPSPTDDNSYRLVGRKLNTPDLPSATLTMLEKHGNLPRQLQRFGCFNLYEYTGACSDLSDVVAGWSDYVLIYSWAIVEDKNLGDRSSFDADDSVEDELSIKLSAIYPIGRLSFGDQAAAFITLEVIDAVYANPDSCGDCGDLNDGTKWAYAITNSSGSTPGTAPRLIYTTDGGLTWGQSSVDGLGDIENPSGIDVVGNRLVVYTRTAGSTTISGYYWSTINQNTGVPGVWTKVTSGFVASFQIYDMFVLSNTEVFFAADGGYVYKSTDITSGVFVVSQGNATSTALRRIHGFEDTIVAVGGSGVVIRSTNRGATWQTTTASPVVSTLQAVSVVSEKVYWVGSASGQLFYTLNGGETWVQKSFSGSGFGQVRDIVHVTDEVFFVSHDTAAPLARLFTSWDGGASTFTNDAPRIMNMPIANRFNRIAVPRTHESIDANNVLLAGLAGNASDGILYLGVAGRT